VGKKGKKRRRNDQEKTAFRVAGKLLASERLLRVGISMGC